MYYWIDKEEKKKRNIKISVLYLDGWKSECKKRICIRYFFLMQKRKKERRELESYFKQILAISFIKNIEIQFKNKYKRDRLKDIRG